MSKVFALNIQSHLWERILISCPTWSEFSSQTVFVWVRVKVFWVRFKVFYATFNNISAISWRSVLFMEEASTRRKPPTCRKSLTNFITYVVSSTPRLREVELGTIVVIDTACIGSYKSNYHTITITTTLCYVYKCLQISR
jgi:hypothetical protein